MSDQEEARTVAKLWRDFRERPMRRAARMSIDWPKAVMVMGRVELIAYTTSHGRQVVPRYHEFAPGSKPLLCAGKHPGQLFILGPGFKVTARGIVDIDRFGRLRDYRPRLVVKRIRS